MQIVYQMRGGVALPEKCHTIPVDDGVAFGLRAGEEICFHVRKRVKTPAMASKVPATVCQPIFSLRIK